MIDFEKIFHNLNIKKGDNIIVVPEINKKLITPFSEAFQAVIWHCLVSHPLLQTCKTKW